MSEDILKLLAYIGPGLMAGYCLLAGRKAPVKAGALLAYSVFFSLLANLFAHGIFYLQLGEEFVVDPYLSQIDGYLKYSAVSLIGAFGLYGVFSLADILLGSRRQEKE